MNDFNLYMEKPVETYKKSDPALIVSILLLWGIGMVTLYICSQNFAIKLYGEPMHFVTRQLISSVFGFVLLLFFASLKMKYIRQLLMVIALGSIVFCLLTFVPGIGVERNGARRWIRLPYLSTFQPSEAIKFAVVLFLAHNFDKQENQVRPEDRSVLPSVIGLVIFMGVIFLQQDFSTGAFVFLVGLLLFFVSGAKLSWLIPFMALGIPSVALMIFTKPYRVNRLIGFFKPDAFPDTFNYQAMAARRAVSAGGFWGQGIGSGLTRIDSIPEVQSDYVFAGWTEAMGFAGVALYLFLLGFFAWRVLKTSAECSDRFASIASFGFGAVIVYQSLMNIAVVAGIIPTTGVPLPFFSSGGSSIIFTLAMCGFIINASRLEKVKNTDIQNRGEGVEYE